MSTKIAAVLAASGLAAAALLGLAILRPASYRLERATTIAAPPDVVQARLDTPQRWMTWSPWERPDPDLQRIFEGPVSGARLVLSTATPGGTESRVPRGG